MPREAVIVTAIIGWLNSRPHTLARKLHGSPYAKKGDPDIYGCVAGQMFVIEVKQPGEEPTTLQQARLREWEAAGALSGTAHSLAEAKSLVSRLYLNAGEEH